MVLTSPELVLIIAIDAIYVNNTGIPLEHVLFSRKKLIETMLLKQQKQNLS